MLLKSWLTYHKILVRSIIIVMLTLFILLITFFTWITTGPRSLNSLTPYIESQLNKINDSFHIDIENSVIYWDNLQHTIHIRGTNINILDKSEQTVASLPEVRFNFDWFRILSGKLISSEITIVNPVIYLSTNQKQLYVSPKNKFDNQSPLAITALIQQYVTSQKEHFDINKVNIQNGNIYIDNGLTNIGWYISEGDITLNKDSTTSINNLQIRLLVTLGQTLESEWTFAAVGLNDGSVDINITTKSLPSFVINDLFPEEEWANVTSFFINSTFHTTILPDSTTFSPVDFHIFNSNGSIFLPELFADDVNLNHVMSKGTFFPSNGEILLQFLKLTLNDGPTIQLQGNAQNIISNSSNEVLELTVDVVIEDLALNELKQYWPKPVSPQLRQWITSRISDGKITRANGTFTIDKEDMLLIKQHIRTARTAPTTLHDLPAPSAKMINASIELKDAKIIYHPQFPFAYNVDATLLFDSTSMNASIHKGYFLDTSLNNATVLIDELWSRPAKLTFKSDTHGPANNLVEFLKHGALAKNPSPQLQSLFSIAGESDGHIELSLPLLKHITYEGLSLETNINLKNTTLPKLLNDYDFTDGNLNLKIKNNHIFTSGTGRINNLQIEGNLETFVIQDNKDLPFQTKYHIQSTATADQLRNLNVIDIPYVENTFSFDSTVIKRKNDTSIDINADLTNTAIHVKDYQLHKETGTKAILSLNAIKTPNQLKANHVTLLGKDIELKGSVILDYTDNKLSLRTFNFPTFKFSGHNAAILLDKKDNVLMVNVTGKQLDLSEASFNSLLSEDQSSNKKTTQTTISVNLDSLRMKHDITLTNVRANLVCTDAGCSSVDIVTSLPGNHYIRARLIPTDKQHNLIIESDDAGNAIRAFGISKHIDGGSLNIQMSTSNQKNEPFTAEGLIKIANFKAIKTPILGKILTLASFKGVTDLLNQDGISFDKFEAPVSYTDHILTITDASTTGSSIGVTGNGTINTKTKMIDIRGVVVPANEINQLIGKIPLVGELITGGKNEGIIATSYTIKGTYNDTNISVNPLSILTPSFLRKIFNILD